MTRLNVILFLFALGFLFFTSTIYYHSTWNLNKSIGWVTYWDYFSFRDLIIVLITGAAMYFSESKVINIGGTVVLVLMIVYQIWYSFLFVNIN